VRRLLPPISSVEHWVRFIADCRATSLLDSAKLFTNKGIFVARHALRRFETFRHKPLSDWLDSPFHLRGLVTWSPVSETWYVLEDVGTPGAMAMSRVEPEEWMMESLLPEMTVIDVGAHQGRYAIQFSRRVGEKGIVLAVEPDDRNLALLTRNLELNGIHNVQSIRGACWSRREPLQFSHGNTLDLSRVTQSPAAKEGDLIGLPLDDLVAEFALRRVDLVKIDVEGAELEVLEGARRVLSEFRPSLFVECHRILSDVVGWLQAHGYAVHREKQDPDHGEGFGWVLAAPDDCVEN
jgi:FkbM family methyltransferase